MSIFPLHIGAFNQSAEEENPLPNVFAYYPLITDSTDEVGGYNGTDTSMAYNGVAGWHQDTADFSTSTGSQILVSDDDVFTLGNSPFSIGFMFSKGSANNFTILNKRDTSVGTIRETLLYTLGGFATMRFRLFDTDNGGYVESSWAFGNGTNPVISSGNFYIILTWDGTTFDWYVDGIQLNPLYINQNTVGTFVSVTNTGTPYIFGKSALNASSSHNGYLGEILFNNGKFTTDEINYIQNQIDNNLKIIP